MTERLGAIRYGKENGEVFLGRDMGHMRDYSEEIAAAIDEEVRNLIDHAHNEAFEILVDNRDVLDALVVALLDKETLNKEQVAAVFEPLRLRPKRPAWTGSERRAPSQQPPVEVPARPVEPVGAGVQRGAYGLPGPAPEALPAAHPVGEPYPGQHPVGQPPLGQQPGQPPVQHPAPPAGPNGSVGNGSAGNGSGPLGGWQAPPAQAGPAPDAAPPAQDGPAPEGPDGEPR
jgi:cell division protease FtsH